MDIEGQQQAHESGNNMPLECDSQVYFEVADSLREEIRSRSQSASENLDGYRSGFLEFDGGSSEWIAEHKIQTAGGSYIMGTPHAANGPNERNWCVEVLLPSVLKVARDAIAEGKKVVFLAEGGMEGGGDFNGNEQHMIAKALKREFGDKVIQDTWDDAAVEINDPTSEEAELLNGNAIDRNAPVVKKLIAHFDGDADRVEAALAMAMFSQDANIKYLLSDGAKKLLSSRDINLEDHDSVQKMWDDPVLFKVAAEYARLRDENLVRKVRAAEREVMVAIAIPGAQHAYQLKHVEI